jgi:polar amino acid transport system ATP-binding protein
MMDTAPSKAGVRFENVSKFFGAHQVLHDISLDIPKAMTTCLIGPSGSGKSTLLRCANLLERPQRGRILVDGTEITDPKVDLDAVRTRIGMVFQHFNLFSHLSVLENVTLALRKVRRLKRAEAEAIALGELEAVGLKGFENRRPGNMSGGQRQRVAIARALAMKPNIMLFDEATSALDPELIKGILAVMRDLARSGITMLVVTHEMRFAREVAGQVVFMDQGRIVELGKPDKLFDDPESPRLRYFLDQVL